MKWKGIQEDQFDNVLDQTLSCLWALNKCRDASWMLLSYNFHNIYPLKIPTIEFLLQNLHFWIL